MSKRILKTSTKIYILALFLSWFSVIILSYKTIVRVDLFSLLIWSLLYIFFESTYVRLKTGAGASVAFALVFAAIIVHGPAFATIIALFTGLPWQSIRDLRSSYTMLRWLFNSIQCSISTLLSGLIYVSLGGIIFADSKTGFTLNNFSTQIIPIMAAVIVFYLLNTLFVNIVIFLNENISWNKLWKESFTSIDLNFIALGFLGVVSAQLYHLEPFALLLLIVPIAVSRQTFSRYMKLEKAYTETIGALIKAIEAKDKYTRGHSERVANLSVKIARQLNLAEDQVEALGRIASLHDIGKIGIPKNILDKPDKLSEEEFLKIKEHPKIGAKILKDVPFLQDLIPAVYYHHEKFDGSGYGSGISGSNIPLFARIIAIADSYDAMTSDRAYRKAMSDQKVMDQLLKHSGSQFDAKIVQALMEVLEITLDGKQRNHLHTAPNFS